MTRVGATATSRDALRTRNLGAVLDAIHQHGPISRTALRERLGLSGASLTSLTAELISAGIVVEAEEGRSDRAGRKPILLAVDYGYANVAGVKVGARVATLAITNLRAEVRATAHVKLPDRAPEAIAEAISDELRRLRADAPDPPGGLVGLGLSVPGIVDPAAGAVRHSPYDAWNDVPFADLLAARSGVPTLLENDVNALAAAEAWFGAGRGHDDFLVVTLGRGVGLGIVVGGVVYRGPHGGAGEFGHAPLTCGPDGTVRTVEELLSDGALVASRRAHATADHPPAAESAHAPAGRAVSHDAAAVIAAADAGEAAALAALAEAGRYLGLALASLVNVFAPTLIVLGGEGVRGAHHLLGPARATLANASFGDLGERVELVVDAWGDDAWARGAAGLAASRYLATTTVGR